MIREYTYKDLKTGENFTVEVSIDIEAIAKKLAGRVLSSRHGKATIVGGMIKAKRVKVQP